MPDFKSRIVAWKYNSGRVSRIHILDTSGDASPSTVVMRCGLFVPRSIVDSFCYGHDSRLARRRDPATHADRFCPSCRRLVDAD